MTPMLPWATCPEDEFCTPTGKWFLTCRAIVTDSWLQWRHALPADHRQWSRMSRKVYTTIRILAGHIHTAHCLMPGYKDLSDGPFAVSSWWDPDHEDPTQRDGSLCLFRIDGMTAREITPFFIGIPSVRVRQVSERFVEAALKDLDQSL